MGHSLGAAIALQVAVFFKEKENYDIPVFADRSFSALNEVIAESANRLISTPTWFGKKYASLFLYAGGGWNMDNVAAIKKLDPKMVHYVNLEKTPSPEPKSFRQGWGEWVLGSMRHSTRKVKGFWNNIKNFFYPVAQDADPTILNGSTLAEGIERAEAEDRSNKKDPSSNQILKRLQDHIARKPYFKYVPNSEEDFDPHNCPPKQLKKSYGNERLNKADGHVEEVKQQEITAQDLFEFGFTR